MKTQLTPVEILEAQISNLSRQKEMLAKLQARKDEAGRVASQIDSEIEALMKESGVPPFKTENGGTKTEKPLQVVARDLPRGVLTKAAFEAAKPFGEKGVSIEEIVKIVEKRPEMRGAGNLKTRVRNLLSNSEHFKRVSRGQFKVAKEPGGALFERLNAVAA